MSRLSRYLKQTVSLQRKTGENDWSEPTFGSPVLLPARVEEKQNMVRSPGGQETLATTRVLLKDEVEVGDRIDGQTVQARESLVSKNGKVLGWEVYL